MLSHHLKRPDLQRDYDKLLLAPFGLGGRENLKRPDLQRDYDFVPDHFDKPAVLEI